MEQISENTVLSSSLPLNSKKSFRRKRKKNKNKQIKKLSVIPLGGLGEIGKNMMVIEYDNDIIVIDSGLMFPEEEMLGIDLVIPDITYLKENIEKVRAIILTHGHEDHVGALPYILRDINIPVYGTKLTLGLAKTKLEEHEILDKVTLIEVSTEKEIYIGNFKIEFIHVCHSILDGVGMAIHTPAGILVHTGDFKLDQTPIDNRLTDLAKFAELGKKGVLLFMSDSTNVEKDGYTLSEKEIGRVFDDIFRTAPQRILVATFASNIHRIQQFLDVAFKHKRKVIINGMSFEKNVEIASLLGYLKIPKDTILDLKEINKYPPNRIAIMTTGSQGEPMSALSRISLDTHKQIKLSPGDTVLISAKMIPGNERAITHTINHLFKRGAKVIYEQVSEVHVSGHASQEELKLVMNLVKPKYFMPIHGEYRHLVKHAELAKDLNIPEENIFVVENGACVEFFENQVNTANRVTAGRVLVDGKGIGDVGPVVLRDRMHLSQDGMVVIILTINKQDGSLVGEPYIVSRGFVYDKTQEELLPDTKQLIINELLKSKQEESTEEMVVTANIRRTLKKYFYEKLNRRPIILPLIIEA
ncbi:ribonuclease J [Candidatus Poribacteria bacterium]|nr:ribonuclease J [Candidatus Poribacteria bacterium]